MLATGVLTWSRWPTRAPLRARKLASGAGAVGEAPHPPTCRTDGGGLGGCAPLPRSLQPWRAVERLDVLGAARATLVHEGELLAAHFHLVTVQQRRGFGPEPDAVDHHVGGG